MSSRNPLVTPPITSGLSRRGFLGGTLGIGAAVGMGALLSACGPSDRSSALAKGLTELPSGTPVKGGTFTAGVITSGAAENLFPGTAAGNPDMARCYNLYNYLFYPATGDALYPVLPGLATEATPSADAMEWTFRLRDGVRWHDGKAFTAADVVYNFKNLWSDESSNYSSAFLKGLVDFKNVRAVDKTTVRIPLLAPSASLPSILGFFNFGVLPEGTTLKSNAANPVGTGPFRFRSFRPGQESVFDANEDYWEDGKPYVDRLVINSTFTDNTAMLNALLSKDLDLLISPTLNQARAQLSSQQVHVLESALSGQTYSFNFRVDQGPFADNRIREGFKLLVDRKALVDGALAGFGEPAYDILGPYTEYYADDLRRERDVDKAKSLFKAAGVSGATFDMPTANIFPGMVESATILADQVKAAGIKMRVKPGSPGTYYTPAGGAYSRPSGQQTMQPSGSLEVNYRALLTVDCPYPDTHWGEQNPDGAAANTLIQKAMGTVAKQEAGDLWRQVQEQQFKEGGYLTWGNLPYIDLAAKNVRGLKTSGGLNFNLFRFCDGWKA